MFIMRSIKFKRKSSHWYLTVYYGTRFIILSEVNEMSYQIGEFAKKCGVNKETIRYYERKDLLQESTRTNAGYRIYSEDEVKRVGFIKRMQDLGFSLNEVYKLLGVVDKDEVRCRDMFEFVSKKEIEVKRQIEDLKRIEEMLKNLKKCCPDEKELHACPIIEVLIDGKRESDESET
ncbi:hypothetical protein BACSP_02750 [Bacillus sp. T2.9-1]|nr:hypothetical protein BACSP_02750 [Bacillus sp. T2.9-1]